MNDDVKQFIAGYQKSIDQYAAFLPTDNADLAEAGKLMRELASLGEGDVAIWDFMAKVQAGDYMNKLTVAITALATAGMAKERASGTARIPSVREVAEGYHHSFDAIGDKAQCPETCRVYERVFAIEKECKTAPEFLGRLADEQLFVRMATAPLMEKFKPLAAQADNLSIPVMAWHDEKMLEMARSAGSAIEIECESQRLLELNRMELMVDQMLTNDLYYRFGNAVSSYMLAQTEENRAAVENCARFVAEFFGLLPAEMLAVPRVVDLMVKVILPAVNKSASKPKTLTGFVEEQLDVVQKCLHERPPVERGPASRGSAVLWGQSYPLANYHQAIRNPARPADLQT